MNGDGHRRDIVIVGASAGGVDALARVLGTLPKDLEAAIVVALHVSTASVLPQILDRVCAMPVDAARDRARLEHGVVFVAPPGAHTVVAGDSLRLLHGPRINGHRPAIDPLMSSAAEHGGKRVAGVILTGALDDGSEGLARIKASGGLAIVQDPQEARYDTMPRRAIGKGVVDHVLELEQIAALLVAASRGEALEPAPRGNSSLEGSGTR